MGEDSVKKIFKDVTVLRLSDVFGTEDRLINFYGKCIRRAPYGVPVINGGQARIQPLLVTDICKALTSCINDDNSIGKTFDLAGPNSYQISEVINLIGTYLEEQFDFLPLAKPFYKSLGLINEFTWKPTFTRDWAIKNTYDNVYEGKNPGMKDLKVITTPFEEQLNFFVTRWKRAPFFMDVNFRNRK
jgi:nucleoside-diphosphate-sugar epimerase